ncbi:hypothetical protein LIA77_00818 [Sarocladium implicatum]|nr:hypothetical protein LIA77_00818 [Sarocladium implicatum]
MSLFSPFFFTSQTHPRRSSPALPQACHDRHPVLLEIFACSITHLSASCKSFQLRYPRSYLRTCDAPSPPQTAATIPPPLHAAFPPSDAHPSSSE